MFNSLCLIVENLRICNLQIVSPTKFADWQFADLQFVDQWKEICGLAYLRNLRICDCGFSPRICRFKKQLLGHLCKFTQGLEGNWFMKKTWSQKSHGTVPLNFLLHVQNCTKWKPQIHSVIPCQLETIFHSMTEYEWISELFIDHWVPPC